MEDILIKILVCFIAGAGAGIGTGFAGMSAAAVIGPIRYNRMIIRVKRILFLSS